jgi:hypothetical protein
MRIRVKYAYASVTSVTPTSYYLTRMSFAPDDNMRTALDALAAEHGVGVRLPRAASRSGLSMWLVSRRVDALTHSFKLANMHNNMHLFLHTLICNQSAT